MSAADVFTSGPVLNVPRSEATRSAYRNRRPRRASPSTSSGTARTALPPPKGMSTAAILSVIADASRIASSSPSAGSAYVFIRVPPPAGPREVEWMQTNIHVPLGRSKRTTTSSPSQERRSSSSTTGTLSRGRGELGRQHERRLGGGDQVRVVARGEDRRALLHRPLEQAGDPP